MVLRLVGGLDARLSRPWIPLLSDWNSEAAQGFDVTFLIDRGDTVRAA